MMNKDEFMEVLRRNVEKTYKNNRLYLTVPDFFGDGLPLRLVVACIRTGKGFYVIHDDGSAVAALRSRLPREEWDAPGLAYSGEKQSVYAGIPQKFHFYTYLGRLVTVANADLFYKRLDCPLNGMCPSEFYEREGEAVPFDPDIFMNMINEDLRVGERSDGGLCLPVSYPNPETSTTGGILLRREGDEIVITDACVPGVEGSILEGFLYHYDYLSDYEKEAQPYFDRFGGKITGENSFEFRTPISSLQKGLFRFFNLSTVLSLFGVYIPF